MNWKLKKKYTALLAQERGYVKKVWGSYNTVCLAFPNYYKTGMANLGFQTVYKIINEQSSFLCERVFLSGSGSGAESASGSAEMFSLESQKLVTEFDILAFSLSFENDYPHILTMLAASGIPLLTKDRNEDFPLIIGGGIAVTLNPEPLTNFFDLFILGETEEALPRFTKAFEDARRLGQNRKELLKDLQKKIPGVYVPAFYEVKYNADSKIEAFVPLEADFPKKIKINSIKDINSYRTEEVISATQVEMGDMFLTEVNRGCARSCRFCAASFVYKPVRFRSFEEIIASIDRGLAKKKKVGLVGTAVSDHTELVQICEYIISQKAEVGIGSMRIDQINEKIVDLIKVGGIETVALAPEAGSQKMRDVLRKDITEEEILRAVELLIEKEILNLRLYFMVGLPGEEDQDIDAIIDLTRKIQQHALLHTQGRRKFRRITLSVNQFIPKPHTPLQWCALTDVAETGRKIKKITDAYARDKQIHVIHDVPKWNYVQALLSLGDRRVGEILLAVHRLDGNWVKAFKNATINPDDYVYRPKSFSEFLPWDIVDLGTSRKSLISECKKAQKII